jgi:hypothetical protein
MAGSTYADYLIKTRAPVFEGAGIYWRVNQLALVPASLTPTFVEVDIETGRQLLSESGARFIRWSSHPTDAEMPWWWMVCKEYDFSTLSSKTRSEIRRGHKNCQIRRIDAEWLAHSGYECYKKAFQRYSNSTPVSEEKFRSRLLGQIGFDQLFEYWGAFVGDHLVGYVECVMEDGKQVATSVIKYDPEYMCKYTSYAMIDALLKHYVSEREIQVSNGTRPISHDTNIQEFLLKFRFQRQYCRLNIQYQWNIRTLILVAYPFRRFLPNWNSIHRIKALLYQEELKNLCQ